MQVLCNMILIFGVLTPLSTIFSEGVGQPGRRRLTEGMCGSTESTTFDWGKVWVNRVNDVWPREGVGQPSRRRLIEGRCGSTESTTFDWGKVWVNRVDDVWLREGVGLPSRRRLIEGRCGSTESTTFDWNWTNIECWIGTTNLVFCSRYNAPDC
jgi:ribosomal protein S27AE